jgi:hypothetical protein
MRGRRDHRFNEEVLGGFEVEMLRVKPVKINEIIRRAWRTAQQDTKAFEGSFAANLEEDFPEVIGNSGGLERIFSNFF